MILLGRYPLTDGRQKVTLQKPFCRDILDSRTNGHCPDSVHLLTVFMTLALITPQGPHYMGTLPCRICRDNVLEAQTASWQVQSADSVMTACRGILQDKPPAGNTTGRKTLRHSTLSSHRMMSHNYILEICVSESSQYISVKQ